MGIANKFKCMLLLNRWSNSSSEVCDFGLQMCPLPPVSFSNGGENACTEGTLLMGSRLKTELANEASLKKRVFISTFLISVWLERSKMQPAWIDLLKES